MVVVSLLDVRRFWKENLSDYLNTLFQKGDTKFPGLEMRTNGKKGILTTQCKENGFPNK